MEKIKTNVKGLFLTTDGNAWHKTAKRVLIPTESGKIRFNGKLYDLENLRNQKPILKKTSKKITKVKPTIAELQKQGFFKTIVLGLYFTKSCKAYNVTTNRELKPSQSGNITISGKSYNLAKLILQKFKNFPLNNGKIIFLNGNKRDFDFNNLSYAITSNYKAPTESQIITAIRLYFKVSTGFNRQNIIFKYYLQQIAIVRGFILVRKEKDFFIFVEWLTPGTNNTSKSEVSIKNGFTARNGTNSINKYLSALISDCLLDFENGILSVKDFEQKPLTQSQQIKKANQTLKELGLSTKISLRKSTPKKI